MIIQSNAMIVYRNKCVCRKIFLFYKINNKMLFPVEYVKKYT